MFTRSWKATVAATLLLSLVNCGLLVRQQFNVQSSPPATIGETQQDVRKQITDLEKKLQELKKQLETPKTRLLSQNSNRVRETQ